MTIGLIIGLVIGLGAGYGVVQAGYGVLSNELTQKNDQIQRLQSQISDMVIQIRSLNQSYQRLLSNYRSLNQSYEKLLNDYRMLNAPASKFSSAGDLDYRITTNQQVYRYTDPVSGNVSIYYRNGTAFRGTFSIYSRHMETGTTASGWTFSVNGYGSFIVQPPQSFSRGPGTYRIGLIFLYDSAGYMIATSGDIGHIYVTVEAK